MLGPVPLKTLLPCTSWQTAQFWTKGPSIAPAPFPWRETWVPSSVPTFWWQALQTPSMVVTGTAGVLSVPTRRWSVKVVPSVPLMCAEVVVWHLTQALFAPGLPEA